MDDSRPGKFSTIGVVAAPYVLDPLSATPPPPRPSTGRKSLPIDFVVKDDGDFTAGPGDFIPIPRTMMKFITDAHGPALFFVQAVFAWTGFAARNDHLGLLVDNVVYPLLENEAMTDGPGVGLFKFGGPCQWAMNLAPGDHTAQVLLRGGTDEGDVKVGLALPAKVKASHKCPLVLSSIHS